MSMEIKRNYNTPISNYVNNTERSDGIKESTVELKTPTPNVTKTTQIKTGYKNVNDYTKYLQGRYSFMNAEKTSMSGIPTTVTVSGAFLAECNKDPEKAKYLEENLAAIPSGINYLNNYVKSMGIGNPVVTYVSYDIDSNGNVTMASGSTNDPDGRIARENAERKSKEQHETKEKLEAKRKEKVAEEKRSKEKQHLTASGSNVWRATENLKNELSLTDIFDITSGFDMKI